MRFGNTSDDRSRASGAVVEVVAANSLSNGRIEMEIVPRISGCCSGVSESVRSPVIEEAGTGGGVALYLKASFRRTG